MKQKLLVNQIQNFSLHDGPGIRTTVFLQGCNLRCKWCHNPETWKEEGGTLETAQEVFDKAYRYRNYWKNGGGITVSGGEALLQMEFVTELFEEACRRDIHTCLDTSGVTFRASDQAYLEQLDRLLASTRLVMLDLKQIDDEKHRALTGHSNRNILQFAEYLDQKQVPMWIRHVVVPGLTDSEKDLYHLGRFIGTLKYAKALDVLPYHDMGKVKYKNLGILYPLEDVPPMSTASSPVTYRVSFSAIPTF